MKKGFTLLETIIVTTFVSVSLILLYNSFINMVIKSKKNILYDDVANIYKTHYVLEYLKLNNLSEHLNNHLLLDCQNLSFSSCNSLFNELNIKQIYITDFILKDYDTSKYSAEFNEYIKSASKKGDFKYRLIIEFEDKSFASLGFNGD